jgi:glycerophosphoryl diester phosphodiesterase
MQVPFWPYPCWIAHRGAGQLAPENTLAAFRLGAEWGYKMFECDVKLSADSVPFLLHDATLTRTTSASKALLVEAPTTQAASTSRAESSIGEGEHWGERIAGSLPWSTLRELDAGSWHSPEFSGEPMPTLEDIARFCIERDFLLNIEIKPTPCTERHTGVVVAREAGRLWTGQAVPPLLTSFSPEALEGALETQPELPRGLLLAELWSGWLETALRLGCQAIVCNHKLWSISTVTQAKEAGMRTLSYTVNDQLTAQRLIDLQIDGIITDRVDLFSPD